MGWEGNTSRSDIPKNASTKFYGQCVCVCVCVCVSVGRGGGRRTEGGDGREGEVAVTLDETMPCPIFPEFF